ncbi:MAG: hypothetical protein IPK25_07395 [Saprospiraceae bacterium]|nr:hypothetical protein [Saprospiraceae bacterium]
MSNEEIISWLLEGDVSIQYQVYRDLLGEDKPELRNQIPDTGWGKQFLDKQNPDGYWGYSYFQPKWISTHYTLLDLKYLQIPPDNTIIQKTLERVLKDEKGHDGGILPMGTTKKCDVCVNGMALQLLTYFQQNEEDLKSVVDFILSEKVGDGGFNCQSNRQGCHHSSLHTTLSVLEGFFEYLNNGYTYRIKDILTAKKSSEEFILMHSLFRSDKTGEIINPNFLTFHFPVRWFYDIFRGLEYFAKSEYPYDTRMQEALDILLRKKTKDGLWKMVSPYAGLNHFIMEKAGTPSRWNTLRALRILSYYFET